MIFAVGRVVCRTIGYYIDTLGVVGYYSIYRLVEIRNNVFREVGMLC